MEIALTPERTLGLSTAFLFVANSGSNNISGFSVDPVTGQLATVPGSPFPTGARPASITTLAGFTVQTRILTIFPSTTEYVCDALCLGRRTACTHICFGSIPRLEQIRRCGLVFGSVGHCNWCECVAEAAAPALGRVKVRCLSVFD